VKDKVKPPDILCRLNAKYGEETSSRASVMIGTLSFLKAVKKSQTYHMLMISQQLYAL
jgi:hypothetical protein